MRLVLDLQACQATNRHRGIGRYSLSLAQAMVKRAVAHDLRIVLNSSFIETIEPIRHAFDGLLSPEQFVLFDAPRSLAEIDPVNAWRCRAADRIRDAFLSSFQPDIVHVASLFEGLVDDAVTSASQFDAAFDTAITLYDLIPLLRKDAYLVNPQVRNWYYRKLQSLKNADLLLAISEHTRTEAIAALHLPEQHVINISSAVEAIFRPCTLQPKQAAALRHRHCLSRPFVMYTGGIDQRKNIEGLIEAFAALPSALRTTYQLAIVCKIEEVDRQRLHSLAAQYGLSKTDILFTGFVPDEELVALYNACTLFVFPSLHEGFGLPALEAMACGAPVIGSNSSSIPEVIGRDDALFNPADVQAITAKMQQALTDEGFLRSLKEHGLEQAKRFSWDASAQCALDAFEHQYQRNQSKQRIVSAVTRNRPRLAYVSPLPPGKSGIADYSAELLPELARYYDIDVIVDQEEITDPWVKVNFAQRSVRWFDAHADEYERIIYHFGNSSFHQHMFELLEKYPGIVVLHDFFLSGILNYLEGSRYRPGAFRTALYQSHGYQALIEESTIGREATFWKYPCNKPVLDQATGVITHSRFSRQLADAWYGPQVAPVWRTIPLLRAFPATIDRQGARKRLGFKEDDFVICSFGLLGPTKLNDRLLAAWLDSPLAHDTNCHLIFVGENDTHLYGITLAKTIANSPCGNRVRITGFSSPETYRDYLAAADTAVQLRSLSRGETSASILDCLAHGIPAIINANGAAAELPDHVLLKLPDEFSQSELSDALWRLWKNTDLRQQLSHHAITYLHTEHHPAHIGEMYREAIENFTQNSAHVRYRNLIRSLATIGTTQEPNADDLAAAAASIARNQPAHATPQLLIDVSELVRRDAKSGIQRVVRNVLHVLLNHPPAGYRVEPIYDIGNGQYVYARRFTCLMLGIQDMVLDDDPVDFHRGDLYLGLDLLPHIVPQNKGLLHDLKNRGVALYFVVFDLLPLLRPDVFVQGAQAGFTRWLETVTAIADGLICISRAVADELADWAQKTPLQRLSPLRISYFHLGADIALPTPPARSSSENTAILQQIAANPSMLMVGTLEPRKGHAQVLSAFNLLWAQGVNIHLVIVGKQGWMVESLVEQLRTHPEKGKRLFWFEGVHDDMLLNLYGTTSCLLAASEAEGFGLPLIEAAQHKLPIIARDLPVFREVAGDHAFYFKGTNGNDLADTLRSWLALYAEGRAPSSETLPWLTWSDSTAQLWQVIEQQAWYRTVPAR